MTREQSEAAMQLPAELDMDAAVALHERFSTHLEEGADPVCIEADAVQTVNTAALQLLISFEAALAGERRSLVLQSPSDKLLTALDTIGASIASNMDGTDQGD